MTDVRQEILACKGSGKSGERCGWHHFIGAALFGAQCCCGQSWINDHCMTRAKTGDPVDYLTPHRLSTADREGIDMTEPTTTVDLVAFLRARLADDEQAAQATMVALSADDGVPMWPDYQTHDSPEIDTARSYLARFQPARVLAEVEAKREVIRLYEDALATIEMLQSHGREAGAHQGAAEAYLNVIRRDVVAYAAHPEFDESWRPSTKNP